MINIPKSQYHLAQINVGKLLNVPEDPSMAGFFDNLDRINQLAEESPGFVWRLQSDQGNATDIILTDDPLFIVNMSVWTSVETLQAFTYKSEHLSFVRRRKEWFEKPKGAYHTLWWIPVGTIPSPEEGLKRLAYFEKHGPSAEAFDFKRAFPVPASTG